MISYDNYKNRIEKLAKARRTAHQFRFLIAGVLTLILGTAVGLMVAKGTYTSGMVLSAETVVFNQPYEITPAKAFLAPASSQKIEYSADNSDWSGEKPVKAGKYYARTVSPKIVGYSYSRPVEFEILPIDARLEIVGDSMVYGDSPDYRIPQLVAGHKVADGIAFEPAEYGAPSTQVSVRKDSVKIVDGSGEDFTSCYNLTLDSKVLNVKARPITVAPADYSYTYNGEVQTAENTVAESTAKSLAAGDTIEVRAQVYTGGGVAVQPRDAGDYRVLIGVNDIVIRHGDKDVTGWYDKTVIASALKIERRKLAFTTGSAEVTYDGRAHNSDQISFENLVEGHTIALDGNTLPSQTDAGSIKNEYAIAVKDRDGGVVTHNYDISYNFGTITVLKRAVTFTTHSDNKTYDGTPLTQSEFTAENLVQGHVAVLPESLPAQTKAGSVKNEYTVQIADGSGNPVTANYEIKYSYGTLTVDKRAITVHTGDLTAVFNGEEQTNENYKSVGGNGLVNDTENGIVHSLVAETLSTRRDVTGAQGVPNETTYRVNGDGDVTENYLITYECGRIVITARKISVHTADASREYNGEPLTAAEGYQTYYTNEEGLLEEGLKNGDTLTLSGEAAKIVNFGTASNECRYTVSANYEIDEDGYVFGTLEIRARRIIVTTASATRRYNAEALTAEEGYTTVWAGGADEEGLLNGDKLAVDGNIPEITNVGEETNAIRYTVGKNYEIVSYTDGVLKVIARRICVETASASKEYDGLPLSKADGYKTYNLGENDEIIYVNGTDGEKEVGLLGSDILTVYRSCEIYEVGGPEENSPVYRTNSNYEIVTEKNIYGTLTITKRPIIVTTADASKPYDGTPLSKADGYKVDYAVKGADGVWIAGVSPDGFGGLITRNGVKDELTLTYTEEVTDVTSSEGVDNACEYTHINSYGQSNYDIHYSCGKLIISGRTIIIVTPTDSKTYDGKPLSNYADYETYFVDNDGNRLGAGLLDDDKLAVVAGTVAEITDFGTVKNTVKYTAPENYTIKDYVVGSLEITQREIYVYINSASKVYDGTPLSETGYKTFTQGGLTDEEIAQREEDGLVGGDKLIIDASTVPSIINVGTDTNTFDFDVPLNAEGNRNYIWHTYDGKLEITARRIYIVTGGEGWRYDGTAHSKPEYAEAYFLNADGEKEEALVTGHELVPVDGTVTEITNYMGDNGIDNTTEYKAVMAIDGSETDGGFNIGDNYEIVYPEYGKLIIRKAPLAFKAFDYNGENALTYGDLFRYQTGPDNCAYMIEPPAKPVNGEQIEIFVKVEDVDGEEMLPDGDGNYTLSAGSYFIDCRSLADTFKVWKDGAEITYVNEKGETVGGINNYTVSTTAGVLKVNKKAITVTLSSDGCEYGGLDKMGKMPDVTVSYGELPYGETLSVAHIYKQNGEECPPKNVGTYTVCAGSVSVTDSQGNVTEGADNYDITWVEGTLEIEERTLDLEIKGTDIYYGVSIGNIYQQVLEEGEEDPLCYGEELTVTVEYFDADGKPVNRPKDAGKYSIKAKEGGLILTDANGVSIPDGLDNYIIKIKEGSLEVMKLPVTVTIEDQSCEYGGLDGMGKMPENGYSVKADGGRNPQPYGDKFILDYVYRDDAGEPCTPKAVDTYEITATAKVGERDANDNYDITWVSGTLEITRKELHLAICDGTAVYGDALPEVDWFWFTEYDAQGQPVREEITLPYGESLIPVNFYYYYGSAGEYTSFDNPVNARTYRIIQNGYSYDGEGIWNENYSPIVGRVGTFTITPRPIALELNEISDVTYGDVFTYADDFGNYVGSPALKTGDSLKIAVKFYKDGKDEVKNAGLYTAALDYDNCVVCNAEGEIRFINDDGLEVGGVHNYTVACSDKTCEILKRALKIKLNDMDTVYGDYDFSVCNPYHEIFDAVSSLNNYDLTNSTELAYGEQISVRVEYAPDVTPVRDTVTPKNVGGYRIVLQPSGVAFFDAEGNPLADGAQNYCNSEGNEGYDTVYGKLKITQRRVTVAIDDLLNVSYGDFNDTVFYLDKVGNYKNLANPAVYGEKFKISVKYQQKNDKGELADVSPDNIRNVGEYAITLGDYEVYSAEGRPLDDAKGNYLVEAEAGVLEIVKKQLFVMIDDKETIYGRDIPENTFEIRDGYTGPGLVSPVVLTELPFGDKLDFTYSYIYVRNGLGDRLTGDDRYETTEPKYAGEYIIREVSRTVNGSKEGLENYAISTSTGILAIKRAQLIITLSDLPDLKYGKAPVYSPTDYSAVGLWYSETLKVSVKYLQNNDETEVKNIGDYVISLDSDNTLACGTVADGGAERKVALDYEVVFIEGALTVVPREVEIKFEDISCTYGEEIPEPKFTLDVDLSDFAEGELEGIGFDRRTLPNGEELSFRYPSADRTGGAVTPKNAGTYTVVGNGKLIDGKEAGADNYIFTETYANLTVNKKSVNIKADDMIKYYGDFYYGDIPATHGYKVYDGESGEYISGNALIDGETLTVNIKFTAQGAENTQNYITPKNAGRYSVVAYSFTVTTADGEETAAGNGFTNYEIECAYGTLDMFRKAITVTVDKVSYEYGGEEKTNGFAITVDGAEYTLPYNETLNPSYIYINSKGEEDDNHFNADTYTVKIDPATATIDMTVLVSVNYDPTYEAGELKVTPKPVTVKVARSEVYYGEDVSALKATVEIYDANGSLLTELPFGDKFGFTFEYSADGVNYTAQPVNAGTYQRRIASATVTDGNRNADNYSITPDLGELVILPFELNVTVTGDNIIYGEDYEITFTVAEADSMPYPEKGEKLSLEFGFRNRATGETVSEAEAAGSYDILIANKEIINGDIANYNVTVGYSDDCPRLEIGKRAITVTLNASGAPGYAYGGGFDSAVSGIRNATFTQLPDGVSIEVAVIYRADASVSARRARTFAARAGADGAFMPRDVGRYIAALDWDNCVVTKNGAPAAGGMDNFKFEDGFECAEVKFEIVPMALSVYVENKSAAYGDEISAVAGTVNEQLPYGEEITVAFKVMDGEKAAKKVGVYSLSFDSAETEVSGGKISNYTLSFAAESPAPTFEITAKKLDIALYDLPSVVFGTEVKYPTGGNNYDKDNSTKTAYGEILEVTGVKYLLGGVEVTPKNVGTYTIVLTDFKVTDSDGETTANYSVVKDACTGTVTITALGIEIKTGSGEKEYDGTPLTCDVFTVVSGALADGYEIVVDEKNRTAPVNVTADEGEDNLTKFKVLFNGEPTGDYAISYSADCGKLKITPRKIRITTENAEKYYDGAELKTGYTLSYIGENGAAEALGEGDKIEAKTASVTDFGTVDNTLTYKIVNADGEDVTAKNYIITESFGELKVLKVKVTVQMNVLKGANAQVYGEQIENLYTIKAQLSQTEISDKLPNGEALGFEVIYKRAGVPVSPIEADGYFMLDAGIYTTAVDKATLKISGGRENLGNYEISAPETGNNLEIAKRKLTVTTNDATRVYNGKPLYDYGYQKAVYIVDGEEKKGLLLDGEMLSLDGDYASITEVGTTPNECAYTVPNANYEIEKVICGTLTVEARKIAVKSNSISEIYDGTEHRDGTLALADGSQELAENQEFSVISFNGWTDVVTNAVNEITFKIIDKTLEEGKNDVTANYEIEKKFGSVNIAKRVVKITTEDYSGVYNGAEQGTDDYEDKSGENEGVIGSLSHTLAVTKNTRKKDVKREADGSVGYYDNEMEFGVDASGTDVTDNYDIQVTCGRITIDPKEVTVTLNDGIRVAYGSTDYDALIRQNSVSGEIAGETVMLRLDYVKVSDGSTGVDGVGEYEVTVNWNLTTAHVGGGYVAGAIGNYKLKEANKVSLWVDKKDITVTLATPANSFEYGNADFGETISAATVDGLVGDEKLQVALNYYLGGVKLAEAPVNAGDYAAKLDWDNCKITLNGAVKADGLQNYNLLSCDEVAFTIAKRVITVTCESSVIESGETVNYPVTADNYKSVTNLLEGHTLKITAVKYLQDGVEAESLVAGTYMIECAGIEVTDENGNDVTANYTYRTQNYGTLKINGIRMVITRLSCEKAYDGAPLTLARNKIAGTEYYTVEEGTVSYQFIGADGNPVAGVLPEGYTLALDTSAGVYSTSGVNVQTVTSSAQYKVLGADGNVTDDYMVIYAETEARLKIRAHKVTVTLKPTSSVYGEEIANEGGDLLCEDGATALPAGERLSFDVYYLDGANNRVTSVVPDADTYKICADEDTVAVSGNGADNYEFKFVNDGATLTVAKRTIIVVTETVSKTYDGEKLYAGAYETYYVDNDGIRHAGLLNGEKLVVDGDEIEGKYVLHVSDGAIANSFTFSVPNANYVIDETGCEYGTLQITAREVKITALSFEKTYDGKAAVYPARGESENYASVENLLEGETLEITSVKYLKNGEEAEAKNAGEYEIVCTGIAVTGADGDVTGDYTFAAKAPNGILTINKAPLSVTLGDGADSSYTYGAEFESSVKTVSSEGFTDGEGFSQIALTYFAVKNGVEVKLTETPKNVGGYVAYLDGENCVGADGTDLGNYEISCEKFGFTITKKAITLTLEAWKSEKYTGYAYYYDGKCELAEGSSFEYGESIMFVEITAYTDDTKATEVSSLVNSGTYYIELDADSVIMINSDRRLGDNYDVTCDGIYFTILGIEFKVELSGAQAVYNGKEFDYKSGNGLKIVDMSGNELDMELDYTVNYSQPPVNAGSYTVTLNASDLEYDTVNYTYAGESSVTCALTISQRRIEVDIDSLTVEDDGNGNRVYTLENVSSYVTGGIDSGFVNGDLERAYPDASVAFTYKQLTSNVPAGATAYYEVTLNLANADAEVLANYDVTQSAVYEGYLTVTGRKVKVAPVQTDGKNYVYGDRIMLSDFGFSHVHNIADAAENDRYGFTDEQLAAITATYTFTDKDGNAYSGDNLLLGAGDYTVSVALSGGVTGEYLITYDTLQITVSRRSASVQLSIAADEFVYGDTAPDTMPEIGAAVVNSTGFVAAPEFGFALMQNGNAVTRYNAGEYTVGVTFAGSENYDIEVNELTVTIKPRTIVIMPKAPEWGTSKQYDGSALTLGENDYTLYDDGMLVDGDTLAIKSGSVAPNTDKGAVSITSVKFNIDGNYDAIYTFNSKTKEYLTGLGLNISNFSITLSYTPIEVHYTLGGIGGTYPYTGKGFVHDFSGVETPITSPEGGKLGFGHELTLANTKFNVGSGEAMNNTTWFNSLMRVTDRNPASPYFGKDVSAIYKLICDNAEEQAIIVEMLKLSVTIEDVDPASLAVGKFGGTYTVTLPEGSTHQAEVFVLNRNGVKFFGVTVYNERNGLKIDVGKNYELDCEIHYVAGVAETDKLAAEIVTLADASSLSGQTVKFIIDSAVTAEALANGRGSLYTFNGTNWQLNDAYYEVEVNGAEVADKSQYAVYVFRADGADNGYFLGLVIYDENGKNVNSEYNLFETVTGGIEAKYLKDSEILTSKRDIYLDFTGSTVENGNVTGFTAEGVSTNHIVEATFDGAVYKVKIYENITFMGTVMPSDRIARYIAVSADNVELVSVKA